MLTDAFALRRIGLILDCEWISSNHPVISRLVILTSGIPRAVIRISVTSYSLITG